MGKATEMKFLVVDDFATMRRVVRNLLKEIGYVHVEEAEDGQAALAKLRGGDFDFVVSDINMPNMNGLQPALEHPRRRRPERPAGADGDRRGAQGGHTSAARTGASGYIVKPFTRATLEEKLQKILEKLGRN